MVESCSVETSDVVKLHTRLFKPKDENEIKDSDLVVVLVHPFSILGGCQALLRGLGYGLAENGYRVVTLTREELERQPDDPLSPDLLKSKMLLLLASGFVRISLGTGFY